jgi:hypothetical protein
MTEDPKLDGPQMPEPVAWCDDPFLAGGPGNCASNSTKAYWARGDRLNKKIAERLRHPLVATESAQAYAEALAAHRVAQAVAEERERYLSLVQATEDILEDGHMNTEYLARLRSGYLFVMDGAEDQPQVNSDGTPHWAPADEVMFWLNEVEKFQGGGNGPTIKLRAAILAITQPPATGK